MQLFGKQNAAKLFSFPTGALPRNPLGELRHSPRPSHPHSSSPECIQHPDALSSFLTVIGTVHFN